MRKKKKRPDVFWMGVNMDDPQIQDKFLFGAGSATLVMVIGDLFLWWLDRGK